MKVVYGMGLVTASIVQTFPVANKLLTLYGEGGPYIGPFHKLVLDAIVWGKVMVKNLIPEDFQTVFTNRHVVDQKLEIAGNFTDEEEIINISPIPSYLIYDGFEKI